MPILTIYNSDFSEMNIQDISVFILPHINNIMLAFKTTPRPQFHSRHAVLTTAIMSEIWVVHYT